MHKAPEPPIHKKSCHGWLEAGKQSAGRGPDTFQRGWSPGVSQHLSFHEAFSCAHRSEVQTWDRKNGNQHLLEAGCPFLLVVGLN